jgi:uncharacterized protein with FMN-binding domain
MKRTTVTRRLMPVLLSGAAIPAGSALAAGARTLTFTGVTARYGPHGPVRVTIKVRNHKIISVTTATAPKAARAVVLQSQTIPLLKYETLQAQSYSIDYVSGATETCESYIVSLRSAVKKARAARALK